MNWRSPISGELCPEAARCRSSPEGQEEKDIKNPSDQFPESRCALHMRSSIARSPPKSLTIAPCSKPRLGAGVTSLCQNRSAHAIGPNRNQRSTSALDTAPCYASTVYVRILLNLPVRLDVLAVLLLIVARRCVWVPLVPHRGPLHNYRARQGARNRRRRISNDRSAPINNWATLRLCINRSKAYRQCDSTQSEYCRSW
jgi:hypothetical protein